MAESKYALLLRVRGFQHCDECGQVVVAGVVTMTSEETQHVQEKAPAMLGAILRMLEGKLLYGPIPGIVGTFVRDELGVDWFSPGEVDFSGHPDFVSSATIMNADLREKMN